MVFAAHRTSGGLVLLADLADDELAELYAPERFDGRSDQRPDVAALNRILATARRSGFAVNDGLSEKGVVAVGVPVRDEAGTALAAVSVSMPSVRYVKESLPRYVEHLRSAAADLEGDLR